MMMMDTVRDDDDGYRWMVPSTDDDDDGYRRKGTVEQSDSLGPSKHLRLRTPLKKKRVFRTIDSNK
jgi:TPP-dependent pyruvate/acetoin dehydrogenase alpha subunit